MCPNKVTVTRPDQTQESPCHTLSAGASLCHRPAPAQCISVYPVTFSGYKVTGLGALGITPQETPEQSGFKTKHPTKIQDV